MNDNNTVVFEDNQFETVVGDEKQPDFLPRVKVKRWDNEVNFSVGVIDDGGTVDIDGDTVTWTKDDTTAVFYPTEQPTKHTPLKIRRVVKNGNLTPLQASSEYEVMRTLPKDILKGTIAIANYICPPSVMVFDTMPTQRYMDVDAIGNAKDFNYTDKTGYGEGRTYPEYDRLPVVRIYSPYSASANPYYMDEGLHNIDIQYGENDVPYLNDMWCNAISLVLESKGVEVVRPTALTKLYFRDGDKLVKFHSAENARGVLACYININCEYNKAYDFYKPEVEKDVRNEYAYGLQSVYPHINHTVVDEIITKFAEILDVTIEDKPYEGNEITKWQTIEQLHSNIDWIRDGVRTDANWWYNPSKIGFEFEVILNEKPTSNIYPMSIKTKGLDFWRQEGPSYEEKATQFASCDPDVVGSYAVYHAEGKKDNEYQTGKAFHIYRPIANDANGWHVFCEIDIDEQNELLNITIPQDFLDNAVYPIVIDPTFGYTSAGATQATFSSRIYANQYTPPVVMNITSISAYLNLTGGSSAIGLFGIYRNSSNALLASGTGSLASTTQWHTVNVTYNAENETDVLLAASGYALLGYGGAIYIYYDTNAAYSYREKSYTYTGTLPDPITWDTSTTGRAYSIYATYTVPDRTINLSDGRSQKRGVKIWP
jgi:hypothetical protein